MAQGTMDHPGRVVDGRYLLLEPAGRGGMAQVWKAQALRTGGGTVAIKRILPALADDAGVRAMFVDEARITASIVHPNVVRVERAGEDAAGPYLALEWVEGASLRELIARSPRLSQGVAVSIARDALRGLAAAHEAPGAGATRGRVIHRDLSPGNVLVGTTGAAKLADFGLARSLAHPRTTVPGTAKGKLGYLPPEVLAGGPHGVRGDVYGMGVVLWEALAGRRLFREIDDEAARARALLCAPRPPIRAARPEVTREVAAVVDRALALDPARRFGSAAAMADALEEAARASGVLATPERVAAAVRDRSTAPRPGADVVPTTPSSGKRTDDVTLLLASTLRAIASAPAVA
jgi:serine/threonine-protein kinase